MLMIPVMLARIPEGVREPLGPWVLLLRGAGVVLVVWGVRWLRAVLETRLPESVYATTHAVVCRDGGRPRKIALRGIREIFVELRALPDDRVATFELIDGEVRDLCPLRWRGGGALFRHLRDRIDREARAVARERRRAALRRRPKPPEGA